MEWKLGRVLEILDVDKKKANPAMAITRKGTWEASRRTRSCRARVFFPEGGNPGAIINLWPATEPDH